MNRSSRFPLLLGCLSLVWLTAGAARPGRADFTFVHITDTHVGATDGPESRAAQDAALFREISALSPRPAFVMDTGDVCEIGTDAEYAIQQKTVKNLSVPYYAAPGNHDVRWNPRGKEGYVLGAKQPLYQSWDHENVHFVLLDSTVLLQHWGHFDQAMLDWLKKDLDRVGRERPVVIGFHHWIGRDAVQADNEQALLDLVAPYNVRLWLNGHGHSDIKWNVNGVPAIMGKGLYQGSYHLIEVTKDRLRVLRRTAEQPTPTTEVLSVPLARPLAPKWTAGLSPQNGGAATTVTVARGDLPAEARVAYRVNAGKYAPLAAGAAGWSGDLPTGALTPGEHVVTVQATLPDGRAYQVPLKLTIARPGAPRPVWTADLGGAVQSRLVRGPGDALYVSTMGGDLVAVAPATGRVKWRARTEGAVFSTPHVGQNRVVFGSADHKVYAANPANGKILWKAGTEGAVFGGAAEAQGVVCIASVDRKIYGLDAANGKVLWTAQGEGMYQSQAATDGERFFVGGWDNFFRALDVKTGREVWKQKFGRSFYFAPAIGSPTVGEGKVFVTSNDGLLHAMDAATGKVLWETESRKLGYSGPLYRDGRIYNGSLSDDGRVYCFDAATGKVLWETPTGSVIYDSSCAFGGGNVFIGSVDGTFSALRASDGALQWQYRLGPGHLLASPATDEQRVYISSMSGRVTALPLAAPPAAAAR